MKDSIVILGGKVTGSGETVPRLCAGGIRIVAYDVFVEDLSSSMLPNSQ